MILKRRIALNGVYLDEVDSRIVISSVEPGDGKETISATDTATGFGSRITARRRSTLDMIVKFRLLEHGHSTEGLAERASLLEKVNAWAQAGGVLTVNYKPNRRLNVILAQAPGEGSLWDYTKEFSLTFRAYSIPYWEDENANTQTFGGSGSGSSVIQFGGSVMTQADVQLENRSGMTIQNVMLNIGGKQMTFGSLNMGAHDTLKVDHVDGLVRIRVGSRSAMYARSGADDFIVLPGNRTCSYSADRACRMTVSWRARYL